MGRVGRLRRHIPVSLVAAGLLGGMLVPATAQASPTFPLSATVVNGAGTAIAGASVSVLSDADGDSLGAVIAEASTNSAGQFSVAIPDAYPQWSLQVTAPGYAQATVSTATAKSDDPTVVLPNAAFSGTVTDQRTGFELDGATVTLADATTGRKDAVTTTDANGYYAFPSSDVSAGDDYTIEAAGASQSGGPFYEAGNPDGASSVSSATPLGVTSGDQDNLNISVAPAFDELAGTVTGASGPIAGARVAVVQGAQTLVAGAVTTSTAGTYVLDADLAQGNYRLQADPPVLSTDTATYYPDTDDPTAANLIYFPASGATSGTGSSFNYTDLTGMNIRLMAGGTLTGQLSGPGGAGASGVDVEAAGCSGDYDAVTGADGRFAITGVAPGAYRIFDDAAASNADSGDFDDSGYYAASGRVVPGAGATVIGVASGAGSTVDADLGIGGAISGHVAGMTTSQSIGAGAVAVDLIDAAGAVVNQAPTDLNGDYSFSGVPQGAYRLAFIAVSAPGLASEYYGGARTVSRAARVTVVPGSTTTANVLLPSSSAPLAPAAAPTLESPAPVIAGVARVGAVLSANARGWVCQTGLGYQWFADGQPIPGAYGHSYRIAGRYARQSISVEASRDTGLTNLAVASIATAPAAEGVLRSGVPSVHGTPDVGRTLTARTGDWTRGTSFTYQWFADGHRLTGATQSTLKLHAADIGRRITVTVTGRMTGYRPVSRTSAATGTVTR